MLKANVRVVAYVDGERVEFQPGEEVTGLHPHDIAELKASGAIEDSNETARAEDRADREAKQAQADFEAQRAAVTAQLESIQTGVPANGAGDGADDGAGAKTATKSAAKPASKKK